MPLLIEKKMNHLNYFNGISIYSNHYYEDWGKINILQIITTTTNNNNNSNSNYKLHLLIIIIIIIVIIIVIKNNN